MIWPLTAVAPCPSVAPLGEGGLAKAVGANVP